MVGIEGTTGSLTGTTHRAEVTEGNQLMVLAHISGADTYRDGLIVMTHKHYRLNEGLSFQAGSYRVGIPLDASGGMLINVGSVDLHIGFDARADGDAILEFFENVAVSNSGASLPIYNRKRDCGSTCNATIWDNPTVTTSGLMIHSAMFLGGSGAASTPIASPVVNLTPGGEDFMLDTGSSYWLKITNQCGRDMNLDYNFIIHEH